MIPRLVENNLHVDILNAKKEWTELLLIKDTFFTTLISRKLRALEAKIGKRIQMSLLEFGLEQRPNTPWVIFSIQILNEYILYTKSGSRSLNGEGNNFVNHMIPQKAGGRLGPCLMQEDGSSPARRKRQKGVGTELHSAFSGAHLAAWGQTVQTESA